jgi:hypothetical protein
MHASDCSGYKTWRTAITVVGDIEEEFGVMMKMDKKEIMMMTFNTRCLELACRIGHCLLIVLNFLLGNSLASECYMPTFQNTLSVPSS